MNNNQDNLNNNPQMNNINNNFFNNQNESIQNQNTQETINAIPQNEILNFQNNLNPGFETTQNITTIQNSISNDLNNNMLNNTNNNIFNSNINTNIDNNINNNQSFNNVTKESILDEEQIPTLSEKNRFINNVESNTNTALNDLNVEGEYNGIPKVDYTNDPKVQENILQEKKKNTITITGEAKVFLIIIAVLLLFTFIMPIIFDAIREIQY